MHDPLKDPQVGDMLECGSLKNSNRRVITVEAVCGNVVWYSYRGQLRHILKQGWVTYLNRQGWGEWKPTTERQAEETVYEAHQRTYIEPDKYLESVTGF